jgi:hypothetical protein
MNVELKKLLLYTAKAIVLIYIIDFTLGISLEKLYDRMRSGEKAQAHYFLKKSDADIFILGSSRALYHYNTSILTDSLNLSCYNGGRSGQSILYHTALLKAKVKHHKPKTIILDLQEDELVHQAKKYDMLNALMPYYDFDGDIRKAVDTALPRQKYWGWSHIYPFNSSLFSIIYRNINNSKGRDTNGYLTLEDKSSKGIDTVNNCPKEIALDNLLITSVQEFVNQCKLNDINLYVFISPRYANPNCNQNAHHTLIELLTAQDVKFYDFSNDSSFLGKRPYFYDEDHLNLTGSILYTSQIATILKKGY